jgi:WD40 repeat protein/class 3 adenylate cyclase
MGVRVYETGRATAVRTFLIADVRGYTRFTRERGDAEAARLATKFAGVARDSVAARGGRVTELRGDEALAVFPSTAQAVRAALELQVACEEETSGDPALPLTVGIGIDLGAAVPVEEGFRGTALNTAARLCSKAAAGQVLVTRAVAEAAEDLANVRFEERGTAELKGFEKPIDVMEPVPMRRRGSLEAAGQEPGTPVVDRGTPLPPDLDSLTPLVDREQEVHWLRGTWRQARRGHGRIVFVSGPSQIGKTRLAAEVASEVSRSGGRVRYAGPGGAAAALAITALREAMNAAEPMLVVLDDLDVAGEEAARALADAQDQLRSTPVLVVALVKDPEAGPNLGAVVDGADRLGDGHVRLPPLDLGGVEGIARLYVGDDVADVPLESMARASGGVPGRVHEVVSDWARDEASRRLAAAAEWLAQGRGRRAADLEFANNVIGLKLGRIYGGEGQITTDAECPYKGLASFEEADAAYFFGRERLVGELAARTVQVGLLGLVGASGSGKSSVVAAGLFPSLRAGLLPGSERWRSVAMRPGIHPMAELAGALSHVAPTPSEGDALEAAIDAVGDDGRLVISVDQFEEAFTLCDDEDERDAFIKAISHAAVRWPERILFVLTIRDDFYGPCAPYRELSELLTANHVLVPPMTRDELRRAIELPARRARLRVEAALADALVAEVADEPGGLPLLSTALMELWQAREDGWLRVDAYERIGGVRGAVARLAEASYEQLDEAEREAARRIFLRLSGIGDGEVLTRRRVPVSEFDVDTDPVAADVLARLTQDRLLTTSDSTVEVAHEALLREWPRLGGWLEEDLQGHQLRQHLTDTAKQWEESARDASELYRGARLSAALDWAATRGPDLNELERQFLAESRQASEREADRQRRTNRRLRGLLVGTAVFLIAALVAGGLALVQRGQAQEEARLASARGLAAAAVANLDVDPERSILLALEAVDVTWEADRTVVPEAEEALHRALKTSRVVLSVPQGGGLAVSPDGTQFATTGQDGTAMLWDVETGEPLLTLRGHEGPVLGIAFSPDGRQLATTGSDRTARLWDARTGRRIDVLLGHRKAVFGAAFSPDGSRLATLSADATVRIWGVRSGSEEMVLEGSAGEPFTAFRPVPPAFSPDGSRLAAGGWGKAATIWDLDTGEIDMVLPGHTWEVTGVAFSPDGGQIVTVTYEGVARTWNARSGKQLTTFSGHTGELYSVAYSADGSRIATAGSDATARVWDATTGEHLMTLAGHTNSIGNVAFSPDGKRLLTSGADGTTRLWDISLSGERDWLTVPGPSLRMGGIAFSPDGEMIAVPEQMTGITLRDADTGAKLMTLEGHGAVHARMAFSPDGTRLAAADSTGVTQTEANWEVPIWDVNTGELLLTLTGHEDDVPALAFSPNGRRLVTSSYDGTLRIWDTLTGRQQHVLDVGAAAFGLGFSPDGRYIVAGVGLHGVTTIWDAVTLEKRGELRGHSDEIQDLAFAADGRLVTASWDGTARIWNLESRRQVGILRGHSGAVLGVAFSPDGKRIATGSDDGTVKLWDAASGRELLTLYGHDRIVHTVKFSADGRLLASASGDGTVALHLMPMDELRELARERVTRSLTDEECRQYLNAPRCPAGT